jgi:hypothetical protein
MTVDASMIPDLFELRDADKLNPLWARLSGHYRDRLAMLRAQNDADLSAEETARIRGQIKEVKALLSMGRDKPIIS